MRVGQRLATRPARRKAVSGAPGKRERENPRLRPRGSSLSGEKNPPPLRLGGDGPEAVGSAAQPMPPGLTSPHLARPLQGRSGVGPSVQGETHNRAGFRGSQVAQSSDFGFPPLDPYFPVNTTLLGDLPRMVVAER